MAFKCISAASVALMALLSNSNSPNLVAANFQKVGQGVVRIDLERQFINHIESLQLADTVDVNKSSSIPDSNSLNSANLLVEVEENNYSALREQNRRTIGRTTK